MKIIYWSGTGNTETIAKLIAKGITNQGLDTQVINISESSVENIKDEFVILGCPSMGNEELEECEFVPFLESVQDQLINKRVFLFGSYGWGDREWMRTWEENMNSIGVDIPLDPLIINGLPEGEDEDSCIKYGEEIAKLIK